MCDKFTIFDTHCVHQTTEKLIQQPAESKFIEELIQLPRGPSNTLVKPIDAKRKAEQLQKILNKSRRTAQSSGQKGLSELGDFLLQNKPHT